MYVSWEPSDCVVIVDASALVVKYTCGLSRALCITVEMLEIMLGFSPLRIEDTTEAWFE